MSYVLYHTCDKSTLTLNSVKTAAEDIQCGCILTNSPIVTFLLVYLLVYYHIL